MNITSASIALHCHNKWRDLPGILPLAHHLDAKHGHDVTIVGKHVRSLHYWEWARRIQPDVIVFPKLIDPPRFLDRYHDSTPTGYSPLNIVLPTEMGGGDSSKTPLSGVDLFLAWNKTDAKWAMEQHGVEPESVEIVGNPRFDWFHPDHRLSREHVQRTKRGYGVPDDWDGAVITVASSFAPADRYLYDSEWLEKVVRQNEKFGWRTAEDVREGARKTHEVREAFIEMIQKVLDNHPDVWILLKPHPFERTQRYEESVAGADRLSVVTEDYSARYLQTSDLHIHNDCTTGIEAFLLDVPTVNYLPTEASRSEESEKGRGSLCAEAIDDVLKYVELAKEGAVEVPEDVQDDGREYARELFTAVDGKRAEACAQAIDEAILQASFSATPPSADVRRALYAKTGIDTIQGQDESLPGFVRRSGMSVLRAIGAYADSDDSIDVASPRILGDDLNPEDVEELEQIMDLPTTSS